MKLNAKLNRWIAPAAALLLAGGVVMSADKKPTAKPPAAEKPAAGAKPTAAEPMVPANLALGKTATASSYQNDGLKAEFATDGDAGTRWCAENGDLPQWLQVDLGKPEDLTGAQITFEFDDATYGYKIEGSADGKAWSVLADHSAKPAGDALGADKFTAKGVRYVMLTIARSKPGAWASVKELEVFGTQLVAASAQKKAGKKAAAAGGGAAPTPASVKAPPGWDVSIFAGPPEVNYCTTVCATIDGYVYVGIDEQGSLGREKGRGRVVRLRDTKGTGKADEIITVAKMDNPRGVWADGNALYVLHPPFLTKYIDDNGDGVSDRSEVLVKGVSTEPILASRGADHTTNGFRVGPDGWVYIAMGDFGAYEAVGKDGTKLQMHGGGVVRVRLDGSGLEMYSFGQRNIYDVAIDPFGNVFTRDNTNDGGGWNVRLSHVIPTGNYGYPRLFVRFGEEIVQPLNDYGGGSPCGVLWVREPGLPDAAQGLLTVEWGANKVFQHPLVDKGAGYEKGTPQKIFLDLQRPTDIDYDGRGSFFVTTWANGSFNYSGPNVGYVARVSARGFKSNFWPDLSKMDIRKIAAIEDKVLVDLLLSESTKVREAVQREILRRGDKPDIAVRLERLARNADLEGRVGANGADISPPPLDAGARAAALFTLKQLRGEKSNDFLADQAGRGTLADVALQALADRVGDKTVPLKPFVDGCKSEDARIRLIAAWGLARLGRPEGIAAALPLAGDADPLVQHVAINSLVTLKASDACLAAIDPTNPALTTGALRVLAWLHEPKVVDGLAARAKALADPTTKSAVYRTLARLHFQEAAWDGKSWWGTRPDTSGPYYKTAEWDGTAKVRAVLEAALKTEEPDIVRQLVVDMQKHKIDSPAVKEYVAAAAKSDPKFRDMLVDQLSQGAANLTPDQVAMLKTVALDEKADPAGRAKAIRVLAKNPKDQASLDATIDALAAIVTAEKPAADLVALLDETVRDAKYAGQVAYFTKLAETSESPAKREVGYAVLVSLANSRLSKGDAKATAAKAIDRGWEKPATAASLLRAIARTKSPEYKDFVLAMTTNANADVAKAAAYASERLGLKNAAATTGGRETIEKIGYEKTLQLVLKEKGDPAAGKELFTRLGCIACHSTTAEEPPKGPFLGGIATRYSRTELVESILKPSTKIAQGFETQWFKRKSDEEIVEGFVTREAGDEVELRNATGVPTIIKTSDIAKRGKRETSIMPEGLAAAISPQELAALIGYMETLKGK